MKQLIQVRLDSEKIKDNTIMQYIAANKDIPKATLIRNALYQAALQTNPELRANPSLGQQNSINEGFINQEKHTLAQGKNQTLSPQDGFNPF